MSSHCILNRSSQLYMDPETNTERLGQEIDKFDGPGVARAVLQTVLSFIN